MTGEVPDEVFFSLHDPNGNEIGSDEYERQPTALRVVNSGSRIAENTDQIRYDLSNFQGSIVYVGVCRTRRDDPTQIESLYRTRRITDADVAAIIEPSAVRFDVEKQTITERPSP